MVEKAAIAQLPKELLTVLVVRGRGTEWQRRPDFLRDRAEKLREHGGHQRPLLLGEAVSRVEEEVPADSRQAAAARGPRGVGAVVFRRRRDRPFVRHHFTAISGLRLMRRQFWPRSMRQILDEEEGKRGIAE